MLQWLLIDAAAIAAIAAVVVVSVQVVGRLLARRPLARQLVRRVRSPSITLLAAVATAATIIDADVSDVARDRTHHGAVIVAIGAVAWLVARIVNVLVDEWVHSLPVGQTDNLRARSARTQLSILRRLAVVVVGVIAAAAILWTFDEVRTLGASLLASAGVISIVAGIAAQSSLANLFAGLQLAFAAPIRFDDVVVVEGQWGRVEDIALTYVVVRTWDERRVILPCTWFTQNTFENWTRPTSAILAPVELVLDHRVDVDRVRAFVDGLVASHPLWDGRENVVQVIEAGPSSVTLRVLLSARRASDAWNLRCDVREAVLAHLRDEHPEALPGFRLRDVDLRVAAASEGTPAGSR